MTPPESDCQFEPRTTDDLMALTENSDVKEKKKKKRPANFSNQARGDRETEQY